MPPKKVAAEKKEALTEEIGFQALVLADCGGVGAGSLGATAAAVLGAARHLQAIRGGVSAQDEDDIKDTIALVKLRTRPMVTTAS